MDKVLVTGGAGFVGSHACKALAHGGYRPVTSDNLEQGHEWAVKWGPLHRGDLRNDEDLHRRSRLGSRQRLYISRHMPMVGESPADPLKYYDNNVAGTAKLLKTCVAFGCKQVVSRHHAQHMGCRPAYR